MEKWNNIIIEHNKLSKMGDQTDPKGTVCLRPQRAKANRGGRSYTQSMVDRSTNHINKS